MNSPSARQLPPIQVTAPNGDPTTVSFSADPYGYHGPSVEVVPTSQLPNLTYIPLAGADHAAQLEVTKVTVTATDTVTAKSNSISFDFIGVGQDATLPPGSFPNPGDTVIVPQGKVFNHYEQLLQSGNLNPGQSFQSLAALINQYAAAGFKNEHIGAGQMTSFSDKQGHQENLAFLSSPHH